LIEVTQNNLQDFDRFYPESEEILYANVAGYCYHMTGYGGELCLDWADLVMADYRDSVNLCFEPIMQIVVLESADYVTIGNCLRANDVPNPL
jgi:hypothetical protein